MKKLSICTVCMNRGIHIHETLPANIAANMSCPHVEFVLLDYNSEDGLEDWAKSNVQKYIDVGILKYYKTYEPAHFHLSHSKNMALKLAATEICCLVDADNYAGPGYADWVVSVFQDKTEETIITTLQKDAIPMRDQGGRLCFRKELFLSVRGLDESLVGYGMDDVDLANRMEKAGGVRHFIDRQEFLKFIPHSLEARIENHHLYRNLVDIYIMESDKYDKELKVLYLLKDNTFVQAFYEFDPALEYDRMRSYCGWTMKKDGYKIGAFENIKDGLILISEDGKNMIYRQESWGIACFRNGRNISWRKVGQREAMFYTLIMSYGECLNRIRYWENDKNPTEVNRNGWGRGTVYLNFDRSNPIQI